MNAPLTVLNDQKQNESRAANKPALELDPRTYARALSCVHCGLCLPACPTYTETGHEADSPRGRIQLMRGLADGVVQPTESVRRHLDLCLDCRGCESACPSGVVYHELIEETRARFAADASARLGAQGRFMRWLFFNVFTHPTRLKLALLPARLMQKAGLYGLLRRTGLTKLLPAQLRKMEQMMPASGRLWPRPLAERPVLPLPPGEGRGEGDLERRRSSVIEGPLTPTRSRGERGQEDPTRTVGFFAGCIGQVMFDEVNRKAVELLSACGAEVRVPRAQVCCGAIHHHNGAHHASMDLAKQNIDAFVPAGGSPPVDLVTTTVAGCGAMLREYDVLLRDDPAYAERARDFVSRVRDVSEVLVDLGLPEMTHVVNETITYHDACHLAHAQQVTDAPRQLLAQVPGLSLVPLPESDMCCGAAGTYNLTQPEMATRLAARKLDNIASTGAPVCATGNVGCALHIQSEAGARGRDLRVVHPVEILHRAVFGDGPHGTG